MSFYTLLTKDGAAILTNAYVAGTTVAFTHLAVGDGNGAAVVPSEDMHTLVHEVHRVPLSAIAADVDNPNWVVAEAVLPSTIGGWTIREIGLLDAAGHLIAVGNFPDTYKPLLAEGSGRDLLIRVIVETSNAAQVTLTVDPTVVLATKATVDNAVAAHEAKANPHAQYKAAATTASAGIVQLATIAATTAGLSSTLVVTPEGLKAATDSKAPLNSPALTGTPTAPTAGAGSNTAQLATTAFVAQAMAALVNSSPAALDTLNELALALGNDPNFSATILNALAVKAPLNNPALTGTPTAPTATQGTNTNQLATTEFVQTIVSAVGMRYITAAQAVGAGTYLVNTSGGPFSLQLPALPNAGDAIRLIDIAGAWGGNHLTIDRNGKNINGFATDLVCNVAGEDLIIWFNGIEWRLQ